ncbi:MAG: transporter substrate-binding domain-containing protein [Pseudomonadota bacterium]
MACLLGTAAPVFAQGGETLNFVLEPLPPFIVDEHGRPAGPMPDIVSAACEAIKVQCQFSIMPWRRAYALAESGKADGIFVFVRTPEREAAFHFSEPVMRATYAVFARQSLKLAYTRPQDLDGYTVAAYGPSGTSQVAEDLAHAAPHLRLEIEVDNPSVLRKLAAGRYGAQGVAVMNRDVGLYLIERDKVAGLKTIGDIKHNDYAIGLSRKRVAPALVERFNGAIHELNRRGTTRLIVERYGLQVVPPQ